MQLLIFFVTFQQKRAIKITPSSIDSLNIIPLKKDKVKRFFKFFSIFFNFLKIFILRKKSRFFAPYARVRICVLYYRTYDENTVYHASPILLMPYKKKTDTAVSVLFLFLLTTAASFTIPRAFLARFPRRGVHLTRIITLGLAAAIGANDRVRVYAHELVKFLSALFAFVL